MPTTSPDKTLRALAYELQSSLTMIARAAEFGQADIAIQQATAALALIDGYLLSAQSEYGQILLPLETVGVGSVLYEATSENRQFVEMQNAKVEISASHDAPVLTNRRGLQLVMSCLIQLAAFHQSEDKSKSTTITVASFRQRSGRRVAAVFSPNMHFSQKDIDRASLLYGDAKLALSTQSLGSGIRLAIADQLSESLGNRITPFKYKGLHGLGIELVKSEQLQLV